MPEYLSNHVAEVQYWSYAEIDLETLHGYTTALGNALQAACASTQGVMVFDLSHNIEPLWPFFKQAFRNATKAPHAMPAALRDARALRARQKAMGIRKPPLVIAPGTPGAGF